jgi:hypothetical protein
MKLNKITPENIFNLACNCLKVTGFSFRVIKRKAPINSARSYSIAYTNLQTKIVAVDIFTPKRRQPRSINSFLRLIAHEVAHHQQKPYKQLFREKLITRSHYPAFYQQVNNNIDKFKKDPVLRQYFNVRS